LDDAFPNHPDNVVINLNGEMVRGDATRLIQEYQKLPKGTLVVVMLNSPGGNAESQGNAMWRSYLAELGFEPQVANYILATPPGGITWLTEVNAKAQGIQAEWL
jgi:hypothetical protein